MGKKSSNTKSSNQAKTKKSLFNVNNSSHQKKPKAVKTNVKKLKANVKVQQECADDRLKILHEQIVVKKNKEYKKIDLCKTRTNASCPSTSTVQVTLEKMNVK